MTSKAFPAPVERRIWGYLPSGEPVEHFTLTGAHGLSFAVMTLGATITDIRAPDRHGAPARVVLGFDSLDDYRSSAYRAAYPYFGATVGRYANRIGGACFVIDDALYPLTANEGRNHLHGGQGFDGRNWMPEPLGKAGVRLRLASPDGDQGYPGNLGVIADFLWEGDEIVLRYEARTDRPTHVNLTSHSYFNLGGPASGNALDHLVQIHADAFTPIDSDALPTGAIAAVEDTPFDLRTPVRLNQALAVVHPQLRAGDGFNHNFVLCDMPMAMKPAVRLAHPPSGRVLDIATSEPGVQFYSGNALDSRITGPDGEPIGRHAGLCFETQHFPDTPNIAAFPSTLLRPGEVYRSETRLRFGILS
jgi:aldose 1-epimerase